VVSGAGHGQHCDIHRDGTHQVEQRQYQTNPPEHDEPVFVHEDDSGADVDANHDEYLGDIEGPLRSLDVVQERVG